MGFEPTVPLLARRFSRPFPSTARAPLQGKQFNWRRRRDSNPRWNLRPTNDLANRPLQPLGYSSVREHCGFTQAEQGDYIRESVAFTVADEYNTLMHPDAATQNAPEPGWEFKPGDSTAPPTDKTKELSVSWTASEFVLHQKNTGWYAAWALGSSVSVAVVYFVTREIFSSVLVAVILLAFGIYSGRKPRTLQYQADGEGIHIGSKTYPYNDFKSFALIDEGAFNSISLVPMKRFMPAISMYYDPRDEEHVLTVISAYLPFEEGKKDAIDRLMHRIRF